MWELTVKFFVQEWEKKAAKLKEEYLSAISEYKASGKAAESKSKESTSKKSESKEGGSKKKSIASSPTKAGSGGAYISKEFIEDTDSSSDDDKKDSVSFVCYVFLIN